MDNANNKRSHSLDTLAGIGVPSTLLSDTKIQFYKKGTIICTQGEEPMGCYYVQEGLVGSLDLDINGNETYVVLLEPGNLFGEADVIREKGFECSFVAVQDTKVRFIDTERFLKLFETDIAVAQFIAYSSAIKMHAIKRKYEATRTKSVLWQVCNVLLEYAQRESEDKDGTVTIHYPLSQQYMSTLLGVNRITVTKCMKKLKDMGWVKKVNEHYCITSIDQMKSLMEMIS